ncbi:hypothetical protein [Pinibacter aurantiacus]|uniref:Outer membrane protein beta-barrel domain-containing protein n=1 Tax=Pinibacter aurantiacus TaxID=2851599 RepID=A0A9E2W925_9BACT|nr:hypothetical protein [Pinibacter aurantiacus]MBV4359431.1 hypothetical protein [Pinibacter aurantiacus]
MKKILLLPLGLFVCLCTMAQNQPTQPAKSSAKANKKAKENSKARLHEEDEIIFNKHSAFGIKLATDGYGISFEKGKYKTPRKTTLLQFEFNEKKHPKEEKQSIGVDAFGQLNQAIYGKVNNFYQFKIGMGQQYLIGGKGNKNGVAVTAIGAGGISAGLMKPYYLDVVDATTRQTVSVPSKDFYMDSTGVYENVVLGSSGPFKGWGKMKFAPGLHAKAALRFDYAKFNPTIAAIEAGVNAEYYFTGVEQMLLVTEKKFFFNAYLTILFGRRK